MKKEPTFIAFSTQKGGAGKTTLTVLMASYLYYVRGYDVVVVDCDFPQFSIKDMRERDMQSIESNEYLLRQTHEMMKRTGKPAYPIVESRPEEAVETVKPFLDMDTPPDFIFFDRCYNGLHLLPNYGRQRGIEKFHHVRQPVE